MSASNKVSAFAKRRRLNDGTALAATDSDSSISIEVVRNSKKKDVANRALASGAPDRISKTKGVIDEAAQQLSTQNAFTPLAVGNTVQFSGTREIEKIEPHAFKVRLSKGQICSIYGITKLWVRSGAVKSFGAYIDESPTLHMVFAPSGRQVAQIEAISEFAEFQIESLAPKSSQFPSPMNIPSQSNYGNQKDESSFQIAGQNPMTVIQSETTSQNTQNYNLSSKVRDHVESYLETEVANQTAPRILLCGSRPTKTAVTSTTLINGVLSELKQEDRSMGVGLLDLEPISPAFGCPGTVSLAHFRNFVLGPSHAFPLHLNETSPNSLIASFYVGLDPHDIPGHVDITMVEKLLDIAHKLRIRMLVIRIGKWLSSLPEKSLLRLSKVILPDLVLSIDQSKTSSCHFSALSISQHVSASFEHQPHPASNSTPWLVQQKLSLQSHFLSYAYVGGSYLWYGKEGSNDSSRRVRMPFRSVHGGISFIVVDGGIMRPHEVLEALHKALVMIVVREGLDNNVTYPSSAITIYESGAKKELQHMGVALIEEIDETSETIVLSTSLSAAYLAKFSLESLSIGLVLPKPSVDTWLHRGLLT